MNADSPRVAQARERAEQARRRMMGTLQELQQKIAPRTLARGAWEGAKSKGADLAEDAVDAVRKRPIAATGAVAAVAMFLAREPLMDLADRLWNGKPEKKKRRKKKAEPQTGSVEGMEAVE